jgi:hypothetical protein
MAKDRGKTHERAHYARNDERGRIAHLAARIMVEDGVEDYATAKRKAARQAGVPDTRQLPTNEEVEAALRVQQSLYGGDAHRAGLRELREHALGVMRELERFNPYLTGSVLSGSAGKYADINLHLYTDSAKAVEIFLMDRDVAYDAGQCRLYVGEEPHTFPKFTIDDDGIEVEIVVLALDDLRNPVRTTPEGKPIERARLPQVEALVIAD